MLHKLDTSKQNGLSVVFFGKREKFFSQKKWEERKDKPQRKLFQHVFPQLLLLLQVLHLHSHYKIIKTSFSGSERLGLMFIS